MDLVEMLPPYDMGNLTFLFFARVSLDVIATLVGHGHLGPHFTAYQQAAADRARKQTAGTAHRSLPAEIANTRAEAGLRTVTIPTRNPRPTTSTTPPD